MITANGDSLVEVFLVDLPEDITCAGDHPLEGSSTTLPAPPRGTEQRRLTYTTNRKYPGIQGVRHWLRSSPDGFRIAFLMRDDNGVAQIWTISPNGGEPRQVTTAPFEVASAFSWHPAGNTIAYIADYSVFTTDVASGETVRRSERADSASAPRPEACVFSPDGNRIAYVRRMLTGSVFFNQIFVTEVR
jgi:Tol biopolymer transport system component